MGALLESYAAGHWYRASDGGDPLLDAVTGEEVARSSPRRSWPGCRPSSSRAARPRT
ncbi:hypothetical protein [Sporichthya sp.]|uniref:hypothetical protein n=1 Tax=Sporichthya sp. TaxID=65475 RepID=UPI0018186CFF|nr:hypothetical protein [Sporichthya sp.]MBA3742858.1 hypothetical protein [Sporichthya sp.]